MPARSIQPPTRTSGRTRDRQKDDGQATPAAAHPTIGPLTPHLYQPTVARPLRAKQLQLNAETEVAQHSHPWAQISLSTTGVIRLTAARGTYIVPPSRALWIPAGVAHAVSVLEDADLRTLYLHQPRHRCGPGVAADESGPWQQCRVLEVSELLRALVLELSITPDPAGSALPAPTLQREKRLSALVLDELRRARPVRLGVDMPIDKRLRSLCEAVLNDPTRHATLEGWAQDTGASPRTVARLFRQELKTSFVQWRQQVLLAKALSMAAQKHSMGAIAAELGYASASAFTAMVRRSVGAPPSRFFA